MIATARGDHAGARSWLDTRRVEVPPSSLGVEWLMHAAAMVAEVDGDPQAALDVLRPTVEIALARQAPAVLMNLSPDTARLCSHDRRPNARSAWWSTTSRPDVEVGIACRARLPRLDLGLAARRFELAARAAATAGRIGRGFDSARASHDAAVIAAASRRRTQPGASPAWPSPATSRCVPSICTLACEPNSAPTTC